MSTSSEATGLGANYSQDSSRPTAAWSTRDDERLMQYRAQNMNWGPISKQFPSKTANACRKRHERLMEKKNAESWDGIKVEDLARAYLECREDMWKLVANKIGEKWQLVETKCMEKGLKTLTTVGRPRRDPRQTQGFHTADHDLDGTTLGTEYERTPSSSSPGPYMQPQTREPSFGPTASSHTLPPPPFYTHSYGGGHSPSTGSQTRNSNSSSYSPASTGSFVQPPHYAINLPRPFDGGNAHTMGPTLPSLNSSLFRSGEALPTSFA